MAAGRAGRSQRATAGRPGRAFERGKREALPANGSRAAMACFPPTVVLHKSVPNLTVFPEFFWRLQQARADVRSEWVRGRCHSSRCEDFMGSPPNRDILEVCPANYLPLQGRAFIRQGAARWSE